MNDNVYSNMKPLLRSIIGVVIFGILACVLFYFFLFYTFGNALENEVCGYEISQQDFVEHFESVELMDLFEEFRFAYDERCGFHSDGYVFALFGGALPEEHKAFLVSNVELSNDRLRDMLHDDGILELSTYTVNNEFFSKYKPDSNYVYYVIYSGGYAIMLDYQ